MPGTLFRKPEPVERPGAMLAKLLPELIVALTLAAVAFAPQVFPWLDAEAVGFAVMADAVLLMFSATLIDVASRLRRAPRWWVGILIVGGILLMYPDAFQVFRMAWQEGLWILLPFVWSFLERARELWTLPSADRIEKIRRRTLTFDRLYAALILGGAGVVCIAVYAFIWDSNDIMDRVQQGLPWLLLAFYVLATVNAWRVHQPAFAKRPRSLWPRMDGDQAIYLDPL